jgi:hypothetical protein
MKNVLYLILCFVGWITLMSADGCESTPDSNKVVAQKQEQSLKEGIAEVGMPAIKNWTELRQIKMLYELRDDAKLICYAYRESQVTGKLIFMGKCRGYGIPYATQFSNSVKTVNSSPHGIEQLPQAEPNGLFMPTSAEATWVMLIDPKSGDAFPVYCEPKLIITQFPLANVPLTPHIP